MHSVCLPREYDPLEHRTGSTEARGQAIPIGHTEHAFSPIRLKYPGGHVSGSTPGREHSCPAPHCTGRVEFLRQTVPFMHSVQTDWPPAEYVPSGQRKGPCPEGQKAPGGQKSQAPACETANSPCSQGVQAHEPASAYVPASHTCANAACRKKMSGK